MKLGHIGSDVHALVDTLAHTVAGVEVVTLGDKRGDAHALVDTLADTLADVEAVSIDKKGRCGRTG